jgi:hypothetical protein
VAVEKVHVLGDITIAPAWPKLIMAWSQWRNRRKFDIERPRQGNMGNPFEYQHHATPIVTAAEILRVLSRSGKRGYRAMVKVAGAQELDAPVRTINPAREVIGKHARRTYASEEKSDRVVVRDPNRDVNKHTTKPPSTGYLDGAVESLSNLGWTLLKLQFIARDHKAIALLGKLNDKGKRVRKPVTVTRVKSRAAAIENLVKVHSVKVA